MFKMKRGHIDPTTELALSDACRKVRAEKSFSDQKRRANALWDKFDKNELRNYLFDCGNGFKRCHYCEDAMPYQVEHIAPRSIYPKRTFKQTNMLYVCGCCNQAKLAKYAIVSNGHEFVLRTSTPPPRGTPLMINPRREDPLQFFMLDIRGGTFRFVESAPVGTPNHRRAEYTLKTLKLNESWLPSFRAEAYDDYFDLLEKYAKEPTRSNGERITLRNSHKCVWMEMKRQHSYIPELTTLFQKAPQALRF